VNWVFVLGVGIRCWFKALLAAALMNEYTRSYDNRELDDITDCVETEGGLQYLHMK